MSTIASSAELSDNDLLAQTRTLAAIERCATAQLIAALAELDARRLYLPQGCRSMFTYCTELLHLSEYAAYSRIEAARAARRFPCILKLLEDGAITLTTVGLLAPHLTEENHEQLLVSATHKSKRQVEAIVAALQPRPPVPAFVRKLPVRPDVENLGNLPASESNEPQHAAVRQPRPQPVEGLPLKPAIVAPLSPELYKLQLTMSKETHDKLRRVQDLMRHTNPNGDPAVIFDRAITMLLNSLEKAKLGATDHPRTSAPASSVTSGKPAGCGESERSGRVGRSEQVGRVGRSGKSGSSRHIPAAVKRAVWKRDGGRCAFAGDAGRCTETGGLEYHHVVPFADGGAAVVSNIQLRCRAHNAHEAERWFGPLIAREDQPIYDVLTGSGPSSLKRLVFQLESRPSWREGVSTTKGSHGPHEWLPRECYLVSVSS
jgi:hypothetical protein